MQAGAARLQDKADLAPQALGERLAIEGHRALLLHVAAPAHSCEHTARRAGGLAGMHGGGRGGRAPLRARAHDAEQAGLAAAGRPHEREHLAGPTAPADVKENLRGRAVRSAHSGPVTAPSHGH